MSSFEISFLRERYPGKSDHEIAEEMANKEGYIAVVRYKNSSAADEYTNFGTCSVQQEIHGYLNSPYCKEPEIIFDRRAQVLKVTAGMILAGHCDSCKTKTTQESLVLMGGNDFYFCPQCAKMFCDQCYRYLPLTNPAGGYGMCPDCRVTVQRAYEGACGKVPFAGKK